MKALAAVAALLLLLPAAAAAAPPPPDATAVARAHFRKGSELYRQARYREAIAEFEAAYRAKPHGVLHYNMAQCYEKLGDIPAALQSYHEYLREVPEAEDKANVLAAMSNLEARLAATGVQQLLVYSEPPGAEVILDGQSRGRTPFSTVLPLGTHAVSLVKAGYRTLVKEFVLAPDRSLQLELTLQKGVTTPPLAVPLPPPPTLAAPAAGAPASPAPRAGATGALPPSLAPSPPSPLATPLPAPAPAARKSRLWTWVAAGAGAAALAGAIYLGAQAKSKSDQLLDGTVRTQSQVQQLHDDARNDSRAANVLYGVGGVAGAAGVTLFFVEGSF